MWFKNGLKAQKLLAQGIALGMMAIRKTGVVVEGTIKGWIPAEGNNEYVAN